MAKKRIVVFHGMYGCETGCCGHVVEIAGSRDDFGFDHPEYGETDEAFARRLVTEKWGEEHCEDIDFEKCVIVQSGHD